MKRISNNTKGHPVSKETREKLRLANIGKKLTKEHKQKISLAHKGKKISIEQRKKFSKSKIKFYSLHKESFLKKRNTPGYRRKLRVALLKYNREIDRDFFPNVGKTEHNTLTMIEYMTNSKICRSFEIKELGYFVDGYDKSSNVVYEIDESHHYNVEDKLKEKDINRQKEIESYLGCEFIRIKV